ncbi:MAG TPA: NAD(P)/FAD-dependent oxidoreductase [Stackebrandtia sp.]|uniref:dihydrolipoyl dehydrogenase family protein n=1 Tax=Stackebrandtia sp. TaxID=2023065 RepID=UPI002D40D3B9|nr:NAD(P)/FAD-dependent oxidoreductase [Stackebrandtia sp.]HZE41900.1 NAD(P)/FAD-dependent oxidoreductase [Stackebrandtia sp.]
MNTQADIIVLGLGVGGEEVAGKLAEAGLDVLGIEGELVGGECPYWGCIPSKMAIRAANLLAETNRVDGTAGRGHAIGDYAPVAKRIRDEATTSWDDTIAVDRLTGKGGRFLRGWGTLDGPNRVIVDGTTYTARRGVVVACGSAPAAPPIPGLADTPYWTNRQILEAAELPDSLLVLGGGAIGVELAQAWARFGVAITIVEAADRILPLEEPESSALVREVLTSEGIQVVTSAKATKVSHADAFAVTTDDGRTLTAQRLLVSTGRRARLGNLGIDTVGIDPKAPAIAVDEHMRAADNLWAVGDITGHGAFTHMAMYQAGIAIRDILGAEGFAADYRAVPRVTFTDPEVGAVGLTESQARAEGLSVACGLARVPSTARGWIHGPGNAGVIKLVADTDRGVLVGATSAGPWGGEVLSALSLAVHAEIPVSKLRQMIYAYPTFHRGIEDALRDLGQ